MTKEPECHFGWVYCCTVITAVGCIWLIDSPGLGAACVMANGIAAILIEAHFAIGGFRGDRND